MSKYYKPYINIKPILIFPPLDRAGGILAFFSHLQPFATPEPFHGNYGNYGTLYPYLCRLDRNRNTINRV